MDAMLRRALRRTVGLRHQLERNILGDDGDRWEAELKKFLRREPCWMRSGKTLTGTTEPLRLIRRMTLTIGGVPKDSLLERLAGGYSVSNWARKAMVWPAFTTLSEATTLKLGWITVQNLGFTEEPTMTELFTRIKEVGALCPAEVGPHLRLADKDQKRGTRYEIAVLEPTAGLTPEGNPNFFCVGRDGDGERWLDADYPHLDHEMPLDHTIVYVLRK